MPTGWSGPRAVVIAVGAAAGAGARWGVLTSVSVPGQLPWAVVAGHLVGSHPRARLVLHDGAAIGFCGGLTTFSTFSLEIVNLLRDGHVDVAVTYGAVSVALSIAGVIAGAGLLRRVRAVLLPVEEEL